MKKLMIAAAAAAMISGAFADAVVYDVKISGKKAVSARGKVQGYAKYYTGKDDKEGNAITKMAYFAAFVFFGRGVIHPGFFQILRREAVS